MAQYNRQRIGLLAVDHDHPIVPPWWGAFISALGEGEDHYSIPSLTIATIRPVRKPGGGWASQVSELRPNGTIRQDWTSYIYLSLGIAKAMAQLTA